MTDTVRETKRVNELKPGDWIAAGPYNDQPDGTDDAEVLHVHPYADGRRVAVTIQEVTIPEPAIIHLFADGQVTLLTAEDIAEHRAEDQRAQRIANLRELADWLEANPWAPMPNFFDAAAHLDERHIGGPSAAKAYAMVHEVAARLGLEAEERLDDRTQVAKRFGQVRYRVLAWHPDGRPAKPAPVPSGAVADEKRPECSKACKDLYRPDQGVHFVGCPAYASPMPASSEKPKVALIRCGCGPTHTRDCSGGHGNF